MFVTCCGGCGHTLEFGRRAVLASAISAWFVRRSAWADTTDAGQTIERLCAALMQIMRLGKAAPFAQRYGVVAPVIEQVLDLATILEVSVGARWGALSADDRASLLDAFSRYTVSTYVANFDDYTGQRFEVLPNTRAVAASQVVSSRIVRRDGTAVSIDYVMREESGQWRVVDVLLDGSISRVALQRSDFRSLLDRGGTAALLSNLRQKITELQAQS
jgi:phospholipid transport system substrate-binding protein